jgi:hypothetical protein
MPVVDRTLNFKTSPSGLLVPAIADNSVLHAVDVTYELNLPILRRALGTFQGPPGMDGEDGRDGKDGRDGRDGIGTPGAPGAPGASTPGTQGPPGMEAFDYAEPGPPGRDGRDGAAGAAGAAGTKWWTGVGTPNFGLSAITFVNAGTASGVGGTTGDVSPGLPTGLASGDLMVVMIQSGAAPTTPAGWTLQFTSAGYAYGNAYKQYIYTKIAGSSETTPAFHVVATTALGVMHAYRGVDNSTPLDGTISSGAASATTTVALPAITLANTNDRVVYFAGTLPNLSEALTMPGNARVTGPSTFGIAGQFEIATSDIVETTSGVVAATSYSRVRTDTTALGTTIGLHAAAGIDPTSNGDLYLDRATGEVWQKVAGNWIDQGFSLRGLQGIPGLDGLDGTDGTDGAPAPTTVLRGPTGGRPSAAPTGTPFYDTTLSKPIWADGTVWRDAAGTAV